MATLTIRNLDEDVRDALRLRARENGRSTEAEVRFLLERAMAESVVPPGHRLTPRRRFADIEPLEFDHPESTQEVLNQLRGDR